MSQIVLARVDDRLIHGQAMTAWLQYTDGNHIVIIDNGTAQDSFLQTVMKMSVPQGIAFSVFDETAGAEFLQKDHGNEKLLLLAKTPATYLHLVEAGVQLQEIIIGGMGAAAQRTKLYKNISASEEERQIFKKLLDQGIQVKVQIVPTDKATNVAGLLE